MCAVRVSVVLDAAEAVVCPSAGGRDGRAGEVGAVCLEPVELAENRRLCCAREDGQEEGETRAEEEYRGKEDDEYPEHVHGVVGRACLLLCVAVGVLRWS